jgi:hypothetical protein
MSNRNDTPVDDAPAHFTGEEGGEERTTPAKNLAASCVIAVFGIAVMVLSVQLEVPDMLATAPGLLPFLTGGSLVLMATGLAFRSIRAGGLRGRLYRPDPRHWLAAAEIRRTIGLMSVVFVYIVAVDLVWFEVDIPLGFFALPFSSFELISAIALTIILKLFWRAALWRCGLVALLYAMALTNVFRFGFVILLPGAA